jgi:hypothetical protein
MTCLPQSGAASIFADCSFTLHGFCSEDHECDGKNPEHLESNHDCEHQLDPCQCLQSVIPNNRTGVRVILNQNAGSLFFAFSSTPWIQIYDSSCRTLEMAYCFPAPKVRLHLLLEHFLI